MGVRGYRRYAAPLALLAAAVTASTASASGINGKLAYVSDADGDDDIYLIDSTGGTPQQLTGIGGIDKDESDPAFSPDGSKIAFARITVDATPTSTARYDIFVINVDGSGIQQLTTTNGLSERYPSWSPDGKKIVFRRNTQQGAAGSAGGLDIYVMDVTPGATPVGIVKDAGVDSEPAWSPQGDKIVYAHQTGATGTPFIVNVVSADGSNPVTIAGTGDNRYPSWSPDGQQVIMRSSRDGANAIWRMNADGTNPVKVTPGGRGDSYPIFSPDGTKLAYRRSNDLFVANLEGNGSAIVNSTAKEFAMAWQPLPAPDVLVTQEAQPSIGVVGGTVAFVVKLRNTGAGASNPITLTDTPPAGVPVQSVAASAGSCTNGSPIVCSLPGLAPATEATVTITVKPFKVGTIVNHAVAASDGDILPANNTSDASVEIRDKSASNCTVQGTDAAETIVGTAGADVICAGGGDDIIRALGGNDVIVGGPGNDRIDPGAGNDTVDAGAGNDVVLGSKGADLIRGGIGRDDLRGGAGKDRIFGNKGRDAIRGLAGNDQLDGGLGNDLVDGGLGGDLVIGGRGADTLLGGLGNDKLNALDKGGRDLVNGGAGKDTALIDGKDKAANVEIRKRS